VTFLIGFLSLNIYRKFILTYRIFGKPKKRDFHKTPVPNSSGIVFLFVFIIAVCGIKSYIDVFDLFNIIVGGTSCLYQWLLGRPKNDQSLSKNILSTYRCDIYHLQQ
jgi:UDP-N-acetylmuramyl pentapeptide phosphotransferase/UDP-N-acetylglucosamine-1-phosphate transferase